jgi:phage terminase Nu1 subunit (DNA packaging protein)
MIVLSAKDVAGVKSYWMTRVEAAASCGVHIRTYDSWGVLAVAKCGNVFYYDTKTILDNRVANVKGDDVFDEDQKITKAQADLQLTLEKTRKEKFKNDVDEGKYIPLDVLEILCAGLSSRIGAELDSLPLVIKRKHGNLPYEVIEDLEKSFRKCQNSISNLHEQVDEILDEYDLDENTSN